MFAIVDRKTLAIIGQTYTAEVSDFLYIPIPESLYTLLLDHLDLYPNYTAKSDADGVFRIVERPKLTVNQSTFIEVYTEPLIETAHVEFHITESGLTLKTKLEITTEVMAFYKGKLDCPVLHDKLVDGDHRPLPVPDHRSVRLFISKPYNELRYKVRYLEVS